MAAILIQFNGLPASKPQNPQSKRSGPKKTEFKW